MTRLSVALFVLLFCSTALGQHNKWGVEPVDIEKEFVPYVVSFDSDDDNDDDGDADLWRIPEWVAYEIKRGPDRSTLTNRPSWKTDDGLFSQEIAPGDASYKDSGFDRGHMCMREIARRRGTQADKDSFSLLNAVPQLHEFNDGIWKGMENKTMQWADAFGTVWVICGPICRTRTGNRRPRDFIGDDDELDVAVPHRFFKIVVRESNTANRPHVLAFIYDHKEGLGGSGAAVDHRPFLKSVREIETLTALDFFTTLSEADQDAIEEPRATTLWPVTGDFRDVEPFAAPDVTPEAAPSSAPEPRVAQPPVREPPPRRFRIFRRRR